MKPVSTTFCQWREEQLDTSWWRSTTPREATAVVRAALHWCCRCIVCPEPQSRTHRTLHLFTDSLRPQYPNSSERKDLFVTSILCLPWKLKNKQTKRHSEQLGDVSVINLTNILLTFIPACCKVSIYCSLEPVVAEVYDDDNWIQEIRREEDVGGGGLQARASWQWNVMKTLNVYTRTHCFNNI